MKQTLTRSKTLLIPLAAYAALTTSCGGTSTHTLDIVDGAATPQTKALLANLCRVGDEGTYMFGHHNDLLYGRGWELTPGRSDTREVCGEFPGVFSMDFAPMIDDRADSPTEAPLNEGRLRTIREAYSRGEVIMGCIHINNPSPEGTDSWDNTPGHTVWPDILIEGTPTNTVFMRWLDNLADIALGLRGDGGELIPIIFRPFHEHTQDWSWWGSERATPAEFVKLWRMTATYLRDTRGVHNFLYAISPHMNDWHDTRGIRERLRYTWPGDEWVDYIGIDSYHGPSFDALRANLLLLEEFAAEKQKPFGITEMGWEGFTMADYWSRGVTEPLAGTKVSMVTMWRNKFVGDLHSPDIHYYSVWKGHPSEDDFRKMFSSPATLFSGELAERKMYTMPTGYAVK